jgi:hypothetical protein
MTPLNEGISLMFENDFSVSTDIESVSCFFQVGTMCVVREDRELINLLKPSGKFTYHQV